MKTMYRVKNVFDTVQGEGHHSGTAATFVRLTACNLWSGLEKDRVRDAEHHMAACPLWCDTDFVGGQTLLDADLAAIIAASPCPLVVFTGGEPMLQLAKHPDILRMVADMGKLPCIETNGTVSAAALGGMKVWITCSPKVAPLYIKLRTCSELKVVIPGHDPLAYDEIDATHRFVQPLADADRLLDDSHRLAFNFVLAHPAWRISVQSHKVIGAP